MTFKPPIIARFYQRILSIVHIPPTLGSAAAVKEKGKRQKRELKLDTHPSNKRRRRGGDGKKEWHSSSQVLFCQFPKWSSEGREKAPLVKVARKTRSFFPATKSPSIRRRAGDGASDDGFCGISTICPKIWIVKSARMDNTSRAVRRLGMEGERRKRGGGNSRPPQKS